MARATNAIPHSDAFAHSDTNTPANSIANTDLDGYTSPFPDLASHSNGDTFTAHADPNCYPDALSNRPVAH